MSKRILALLAAAALVLMAGCNETVTFSLNVGGAVKDQATDFGISGVAVRAEVQGKPGQVTTSTNVSGGYSLTLTGLKAGSVITVNFSHADYYQETRTFTRSAGGSHLLNVYMVQETSVNTISGYATLMNLTPPAGSKLPLGSRTVVSSPKSYPEPAEIIVAPRHGANFPTMEGFALKKGSAVLRSNPKLGVIIMKVPKGRFADEFAAEVAMEPWADYAEPNGYLYASYYSIPDDDDFGDHQWNLFATTMPFVWGGDFLSPNVTVAVIDTRVDVEHPDLMGQVDDLVDFTGSPYLPGEADYPHGTHVAGIIGAVTDNNSYMAGMNLGGITIMPLRGLKDDGYGSYEQIASAIQYAADNGADIINLSLGGSPTTDERITVTNSINAALAKGIAVVAAAGNQNSSDINFPANLPGVISVSAVDDSFERASYSNFSPDLDLAAPGGSYTLGVRSLFPRDRGYTGSMSGTSQATPHVSALIAMLMQQGYSAGSAVDMMRKTAQLSDIMNSYYGSGIINAYAALEGLTMDKAVFWIADTLGQPVPGYYGYGNADDKSFEFPSLQGVYYLRGWIDIDADGDVSAGDYYGSEPVTIGEFGLFRGSNVLEMYLFDVDISSTSRFGKSAVQVPDLKSQR